MWSSKDEDTPLDSLNTVMILAQKLKLNKPETTTANSYDSFCCGDIKQTSSPRDDKNSSQNSKQSAWKFNGYKAKTETFGQVDGNGVSCGDIGMINRGLSPILKARNQSKQQRYPLKTQTAVDIDSDIDETASSIDSDYSDIYTSDDCCKELPSGYNSSNVDNVTVDKSTEVYAGKPVYTSVEQDVNKNVDMYTKKNTKTSVVKDKQMCVERDTSSEQVSSDNSQMFTLQTSRKPIHSIVKNKVVSFSNKDTTRQLSTSKENVPFLQPCSPQQTNQVDRRDLDSDESSGMKPNPICRLYQLALNKNKLNYKDINVNGSFESERSSVDTTESNKQTLSVNKCKVFIRDNYFNEAIGTLRKSGDTDGQHSENNAHDFGQKLNILQGELIQLREHDEQLATQFLQIYRDIQILKVQRACQTHQDLLDDAIDEVEERDRLIDLCDTPPLKYSESKLRHCGLTKMNICSQFQMDVIEKLKSSNAGNLSDTEIEDTSHSVEFRVFKRDVPRRLKGGSKMHKAALFPPGVEKNCLQRMKDVKYTYYEKINISPPTINHFKDGANDAMDS